MEIKEGFLRFCIVNVKNNACLEVSKNSQIYYERDITIS